MLYKQYGIFNGMALISYSFVSCGVLNQLKINVFLGFTVFKQHYHTILQLMPYNYEQSVGKLQNYINDDQICMILNNSNSTTAIR